MEMGKNSIRCILKVQFFHTEIWNADIGKISDYLSVSAFPTPIKSGRKQKVPNMETINPPIIPAASGNQNASLDDPTIKGTKPKAVDVTVRKMGLIFAFHALI